MSALDRYRKRENKDALKRYKEAPRDDLGALAKYITGAASDVAKGYWNRQGRLAREGLAQADQGARQVRGGNVLEGGVNMLMGPVGYVASPVNALLPTEQEVYGARDLPEGAKPLVAGGLATMAAFLPGNKKGMGSVAKAADDAVPEGITAYHGSPHTFDRFDMSKIGTGEGAQVYGHGLYFAEAEDVAKTYRNAGPAADAHYDRINKRLSSLADEMHKLEIPGQYRKYRDQAAGDKLAAEYDSLMASRKDIGSTYKVRLNVKPDELLDWDRPLSEQPERVTTALRRSGLIEKNWRDYPNVTGGGAIADVMQGDSKTKARQLSSAMRAQGVKGIRYLDQGSRPIDAAFGPEAQAQARASLAKAVESGDKVQADHLRKVIKNMEDGAARQKTYNYVIFDDKLVDILKRYGVAITAGAGGAAIVSGQDMPPEVAAQLGPQA